MRPLVIYTAGPSGYGVVQHVQLDGMHYAIPLTLREALATVEDIVRLIRADMEEGEDKWTS